MTVPDGNAKVNGTSGDLVLSCNDGLVMTYSTLGNVSVRVESPASVISACQSGKWSVDLSSVVCCEFDRRCTLLSQLMSLLLEYVCTTCVKLL